MDIKKACCFFVLLAVSPLWAGYSLFVSSAGNDTAAGTSPENPVKTLQKAAELARGVKNEPVTVFLKGGSYELTGPLTFGFDDSRTAESPLVFKPFRNETPVLSGGRRIGNWHKQPSGLWTASIEDVKNDQWVFTQLFVNGQRRHRSRIPNEGFLRVAGFPDGARDVNYHTDCQRFEYKPGDIDPNWMNLDDAEVIVYHFWTDSHLPIESIDTDKHIVTFKHKAGKVFTDDFTDNGARFIIENVYEGLDSPGEWYLNRKTGLLSYLPMPDEDMSTAEIIAPVAPNLIHMQGNAAENQFLENIRFEGIAFGYTNFYLPPGNSNDAQGSSSVPAAIKLNGCRDITFDGCTVRNTGTFAFDIAAGCSGIQLTRNIMSELGGGGIRINGGSENDPPLLRTGHNTVSDNIIGPYGTVYPSAVGVLLMHTFSNTVSHNEIHHGWYTGVSVGWHWGYQRSISRDNLIEFNHIHDIGQGLLSDMGAIYTLGISPGTVIRGNLIHDIDANHYGGWGIYNDEGSSHILIENNIVYNTKFAGYNIHYAKEITVRNNIFAFGRLQQFSRGRVEPHKSCFFENNIVYFTEGKLLDNSWKDTPYTFYYNPSQPEGRQTQSTFDMDWNLYYNPNVPLEEMSFNGMTFADWQKSGKDRHSLYEDPLFVDAQNFDFRLKADSPAFKLGFKQIDMSAVGPRR